MRFLMADESVESLVELGRMVADGELEVPIDRTSPLEETADALRLIGAGGALGKVIVRV